MSLESMFFKHDFPYNAKLVEKLVVRAKDENNKNRFYLKHLVFKMMKEVVKKNIINYINLLRGLHSDIIKISDSDDLITDCYLVYDKCIDKYIANAGYNFYFYFNKSLLRNFFRLYTDALNKIKSEMDIEDEYVVLKRISYSESAKEYGSVDLLMKLLGFNEVEKRICKSKIEQQSNADFLKNNEDISSSKYNASLKHIKEMLIKYKEQGEL